MEEKEIIKGIFRKPKKLAYSIYCLGFVLIMLGIIVPILNYIWYKSLALTLCYCLPFIGLGLSLIFACSAMLLEQAITVTNLRVYGISGGRKVDIPKEQIASVESYNNIITICTASGKINFTYLVNCAEVYKAVLNLTYRTQHSAANDTISQADEFKKYKELLDGGVISQEEFDAKKKQLLGL